MKTFKQFLNESHFELDAISSYQSMVDFLTGEASQSKGFFDKGVFFYRGIGSRSLNADIVHQSFDINENFIMTVYDIRIPQDRKSVGMNKNQSTLVDDWFTKKFGAPLRAQCIFTSSNFRQAGSYAGGGVIGAVFPASDNANWVYSPQIRDLYDDISAGPAPFLKPSDPEYTEDEDALLDTDWSEATMDRFLGSKTWVESRDPSEVAYTFTGEVMLVDPSAKSYYFVTLQDKNGEYLNSLGEFKQAFR